MKRGHIAIRDFRDGDAAPLRDVFMSSVHCLAAGFYTAGQLQAWAPPAIDEAGWASRLAKLRPFVAVVDGQPVAYADLQASGYIDHFYVSAHVARQGIGAALMHHVKATARQRGLRQLSAHVSRSAEAFFRHHGFELEHRRTVTVRGVQMDNARMRCVLAGVPCPL